MKAKGGEKMLAIYWVTRLVEVEVYSILLHRVVFSEGKSRQSKVL